MKEPDDTPLRREHVAKFLAWYRARVPVPSFPGVEQMWWNALHALTLGQLRKGMKAYGRFTSNIALNPPQFHGLCTGTADELAIQRFNEMRKKITEGKVKVAPTYQPKRSGREQDKPGVRDD